MGGCQLLFTILKKHLQAKYTPTNKWQGPFRRRMMQLLKLWICNVSVKAVTQINKLTACYMGLLPAGMEHLSALLCLGCCLMTKHSISSRRDGWMDGWMLCGGGNSANIISPWKNFKSVRSQVHVDWYCTICVCETLWKCKMQKVNHFLLMWKSYNDFCHWVKL